MSTSFSPDTEYVFATSRLDRSLPVFFGSFSTTYAQCVVLPETRFDAHFISNT